MVKFYKNNNKRYGLTPCVKVDKITSIPLENRLIPIYRA